MRKPRGRSEGQQCFWREGLPRNGSGCSCSVGLLGKHLPRGDLSSCQPVLTQTLNASRHWDFGSTQGAFPISCLLLKFQAFFLCCTGSNGSCFSHGHLSTGRRFGHFHTSSQALNQSDFLEFFVGFFFFSANFSVQFQLHLLSYFDSDQSYSLIFFPYIISIPSVPLTLCGKCHRAAKIGRAALIEVSGVASPVCTSQFRGD